MKTKTKMTDLFGRAFNAAMKSIGCAWRVELITPEQAAEALAANEALLEEVGRSQRMSGDRGPEEIGKRGRPMVEHFARRFRDDEWKWYLSVIYRLPNGGVLDGVTRLLACVEAGIPFWTLTYNATEAEDYTYFDEAKSGRTALDGVLNGNPAMPLGEAIVAARLLPRAYVAVNGEGTRACDLAGDQYMSVLDDRRDEVQEAIEFVNKPHVPRRPTIGAAYLKHVTSPDAKAPAACRDLLSAFTSFLAVDDNAAEMVKLRGIVDNNQNTLRDEELAPAIEAALEAAEEGLPFRFSFTSKAGKTSARKVRYVRCRVLDADGKWRAKIATPTAAQLAAAAVAHVQELKRRSNARHRAARAAKKARAAAGAS